MSQHFSFYHFLCFNNFIYHFLKTVGLLVRNSVSFPSSENVFVSSVFPEKYILAGYKTLGWSLFSFSTMVSDEKFTVIQIGLPLSVISFSLTTSTEKSFSLQKFDYCILALIYLSLYYSSISSIPFCRFSQIRKVFDHSFKKCIFWHTFFQFNTPSLLLGFWLHKLNSCYGPTGLWGSVHFFQSIFMFKLISKLSYLQVHWFFLWPFQSSVELIFWGFYFHYWNFSVVKFSFVFSFYLFNLSWQFLFFFVSSAFVIAQWQFYDGCFKFLVR